MQMMRIAASEKGVRVFSAFLHSGGDVMRLKHDKLLSVC
jgi:hypothetical protein